MTCEHDLSERESECADGACPICLRAQLAAAHAENEKQARLLGMGSEREARLMAQLAEALAMQDALRRILKSTPHSMCADADAWAMAEQLIAEAKGAE